MLIATRKSKPHQLLRSLKKENIKFFTQNREIFLFDTRMHSESSVLPSSRVTENNTTNTRSWWKRLCYC